MSAARALGNIKDARAVEPLIAELKDDDIGVVREDAAGALGKIGAPAVESLIENLTDWDLNSVVANALSYIGWKPQTDSDRIHFLVAQRKGKELKKDWGITKDVLLKDVGSGNYGIIENALYAFIAIGKEEIIPELIETLNTNGTKTTAEAYLNCGHSGLGKAAREWASRHGYTIYTGAGAAPVGWGQW